MKAGRPLLAAAAALSLGACTDPRPRPVPPLVDLQFAPSFQLTSPGTLAGSLAMFDEDGLDTLRLSVRSADSSFVGDSLIFLPGDPQTTRPVTWAVPAGLAAGMVVRVVAKVGDFAGFVASDTVNLTVQ